MGANDPAPENVYRKKGMPIYAFSGRIIQQVIKMGSVPMFFRERVLNCPISG